MSTEIWSLLLVSSKLLGYLSVAGVLGGLTSLLLINSADLFKSKLVNLVRWQFSVCRYVIWLTLVGFVASVTDFFVQTGYMAESGLSGMVDPIMLEIVWLSSIGTVVLIRSLLFVAACLIVLYFLSRLSIKRKPLLPIQIRIALIVSIIGFGYSYSFLGHTAQLEIWNSLLISIHVGIALVWLGALWPLHQSCAEFNDISLHLLMKRFGVGAAWLVPLLIVVGLVMLWQIVSSFEELVTSAYGRLFILKITLVVAMLSLAAWHKLVLVPRLLQQEMGNKRLSSSIKIEMVIGLLILLFTSIFTTIVGPVN